MAEHGSRLASEAGSYSVTTGRIAQNPGSWAVFAVLPSRREPTPILRLRDHGSANHWAIGIYLASTPNPSCPPPPAPKAGTQNKGSMTPSSSTRALNLIADGAQPVPRERPQKRKTRVTQSPAPRET